MSVFGGGPTYESCRKKKRSTPLLHRRGEGAYGKRKTRGGKDSSIYHSGERVVTFFKLKNKSPILWGKKSAKNQEWRPFNFKKASPLCGERGKGLFCLCHRGKEWAKKKRDKEVVYYLNGREQDAHETCL